MKLKQKEIWVDNIKVIACILVAVGHFLQSMTDAKIYCSNDFLKWFDQTIYYFHVPLFLICSGYLYQKYSHVNSWAEWKKNAFKKGVSLGIPYITFSIITWILKIVFSDSVNHEADGFFHMLLLAPVGQMWYLYCLFLLFLIVPTFRNKKAACIALSCAVAAKTAALAELLPGFFPVSSVMNHGVWFVLGMCLSIAGFPGRIIGKRTCPVGISLFLGFLAVSICIPYLEIPLFGIDFLMGCLACTSLLLITAGYFSSHPQMRILDFLSRYTFPIYIMHTIFAAGIRSVLLKLGCADPFLHTLFGLGFSFAGPIVAAEIMKKCKWLEFFLYPNKFLKIK